MCAAYGPLQPHLPVHGSKEAVVNESSVCVCVCLGVVSKCGDEETAGFSSQEILRSRC